MKALTKILTNIVIIAMLMCFSSIKLMSNAFVDTLVISEDQINPKISLVLSGGGARGLAQIGVIKEMEKIGLFPNSVVGTSIGAIIGGIYASGYSPSDLDSIARYTNWNGIFSLANETHRNDLFLDQKNIDDRSIVNLRFDGFDFEVPEAVSGGNKFNTFLQTLFWNAPFQCNSDFNKLKYKFRAIATDLVSGKSINLSKGDLIASIKASATVPLRYIPVKIDSMVLVDGGILSNIPIEHSKEFEPDLIIAVNSSSPLFNKDELSTPWNIADQTVSILIKKFAEQSVKNADYTITPNIGDWKNNDYSNPALLIERGQNAFLEVKNTLSERIEKEKINKTINLLKSTFGDNEIELTIHKQQFAYPKNIKEIVSNILQDLYFVKFGIVQIIKTSTNKYSIAYPNNYINEINVMFSDNNKDKKSTEIINNLKIILTKKYNNYILTTKIKNEIIENILKICRSNSYSFANINKFNVDQKNNLEISIDRGLITKINIIGNKKTNDFLIRRELEFNVGEPANAIKLNDLYDNLNATEYFNFVFIDIKTNNDTGLELNINVDERGTNNLRVSAKVDNQRYTQGNLDLLSNNLFNQGARASLRIAGGQRNFLSSFTIGNPRILTTNLTYDLNIFYKKRNIALYQLVDNLKRDKFERLEIGSEEEEKAGINFNFGTQLERLGKLSIGIRHEFQRIYNSNEKDLPIYINFTNLRLGTELDTKDNSFFATKGVLLKFDLQSSLFPKEAVSFSKFDLIYENYISIGNLVIKPSLLLGFADKTMPRSEFYTMGGMRNFFGMYEDEERGRQLFAGSIELRAKMPFKLFFDTYFSVRYDLGKSWLQPETIKFETLWHGLGTFISFDTPIGPAKFALGKSFYFVSDPSGVVQGPLYGYFSIGIDFGY